MYTDTKCACTLCGGSLPVPTTIISHKKTPWAVICKIHGQVFFTAHGYNVQKGEYVCPHNTDHCAVWDEENYDEYINLPQYVLEVQHGTDDWTPFDELNQSRKMSSMAQCIESLSRFHFDDKYLQLIRVRNIFTNETIPLELLLQHP